MKRLKEKIVLMIAFSAILTSCFGKKDNRNDNTLPDFPETPGDKDSWEYLKDENGKVPEWDLEWYVNDSTFAWNSYGSDRVSEVLKEKTGARIKFTVPVTDDGQKLSTLISGNKLPDIISVQCWYSQCSQLASQGYLYALDDLIEKWAPSFKAKKQTDIWNYFTEGNGKCYGVPNFAYSTKYVNDTDKMEPNGCLMVREDWYKEAATAGFDMTTPNSFINGCKYIAEAHTDAIPFQLDAFTNEGNESIDWLSQYFCSPFEDKEGNYVDIRTTARYQEMLEFLNRCHKEGIIKSANYSDKGSAIRTNISRGKCFVTAVTPQDYQSAFLNAYGSDVKYVPLILRNKDNEAPVLQDISGNGYLLTMITKNCKNPHKAIKLLEYLYSEEGQRLVAFGVEGESYNWDNPEHTSLSWSDRYVSGVNGNADDQAWINTLGLYNMTLLMNLAYINKYKPLNGRKDTDIYIDNMKRPLTPYSYNFKPTFLKHDTSKSNYFSITTSFNKIKTKWAEALVEIIRSNNWKQTYDDAIAYAKRQKLDEVTAFYAESYKATKALLGVEFGYPQNKEDYVEPTWKGPHGDFSYWRSATHE
jgi:putative aldouronate transport system substrate-binding protein